MKDFKSVEDDWLDIASDVREHLKKRISKIADLSLTDVKDLIDVLREAYYLEQDAAIFEKRIELEQNRIVAEGD